MQFYFRFILPLIQLSQSAEVFQVSAVSSYNPTSNLHPGEVNTIAGTTTSTRRRKPTNKISNEFLYIVNVVTKINPADMMAYTKQICTGTMIRNDVVITLASCLLSQYNEIPDPKHTMVYERTKSKGRQALKIYINPNYYSDEDYESKANDFGVIVVEGSEQTVFPRLPEQMYDFRDIKDTCVIGGYGDMDLIENNTFHFFYLNKTSVEIFTGPACNRTGSLCLHFDHFMPCKEDQGSPIICNGVLHALYIPRFNSFSAKCLDIYITSFSTVYTVTIWVNQILNAPTANLEWLNNPWAVTLLCVILFIMIGAIYYGLVELLQRKLDPTDREQSRRTTVRGVDIKESGTSSLNSSSLFSNL